MCALVVRLVNSSSFVPWYQLCALLITFDLFVLSVCRRLRFYCSSQCRTVIVRMSVCPLLVADVMFLDASTHLYKRVCPSVRPSVRRSVGPSVGPERVFLNEPIMDENGRK